MITRYYPDLEALGDGAVIALRVLVEQLLDDPLWLDRGDCPYDEAMKDSLRGVVGLLKRKREVAATVVERARDPAEKWQDLAKDAESLYADLRRFQRDVLGTGGGGGGGDDGVEGVDAKDHLAFYRTATQLIDKLVQLGERATNLRQISDYQGRVVRVFEVVLDGEQRTRAMKILQGDGVLG